MLPCKREAIKVMLLKAKEPYLKQVSLMISYWLETDYQWQ